MKRKSGNIEDIKFDYKTQHGQAAIGNPIPLRRSNQTSSFWVDRNLQKEAAIQHTKDMEEQFRDRIVYSRENTKLYDVDWKCLPTANRTTYSFFRCGEYRFCFCNFPLCRSW